MFLFAVNCHPNLVRALLASEGSTERTLVYRKYKIENLSIDWQSALTVRSPEAIYVANLFINDGSYSEIHGPRKETQNYIIETHLKSCVIFENNGIFIYDSKNPQVAPRLRFGETKTFVNKGILRIRLGGTERPPDTPGLHRSVRYSRDPDVHFLASGELRNFGEIVLIGYGPRSLLAKMELMTEYPNVIENPGLIILLNAHLLINNGVRRKGCITVLSESTLVLSKPNEFSAEQFIYLRPGQHRSTLEIRIGDSLPQFNLTVRGFNPNCKIRFSLAMRIYQATHTGTVYFGFGYNKFAGSINLYPYTVNELDFDGSTITTARDMPVLPPTNCYTKALYLEKELLDLREALFGQGR